MKGGETSVGGKGGLKEERRVRERVRDRASERADEEEENAGWRGGREHRTEGGAGRMSQGAGLEDTVACEQKRGARRFFSEEQEERADIRPSEGVEVRARGKHAPGVWLGSHTPSCIGVLGANASCRGVREPSCMGVREPSCIGVRPPVLYQSSSGLPSEAGEKSYNLVVSRESRLTVFAPSHMQTTWLHSTSSRRHRQNSITITLTPSSRPFIRPPLRLCTPQFRHTMRHPPHTSTQTTTTTTTISTAAAAATSSSTATHRPSQTLPKPPPPPQTHLDPPRHP